MKLQIEDLENLVISRDDSPDGFYLFSNRGVQWWCVMGNKRKHEQYGYPDSIEGAETGTNEILAVAKVVR